MSMSRAPMSSSAGHRFAALRGISSGWVVSRTWSCAYSLGSRSRHGVSLRTRGSPRRGARGIGGTHAMPHSMGTSRAFGQRSKPRGRGRSPMSHPDLAQEGVRLPEEIRGPAAGRAGVSALARSLHEYRTASVEAPGCLPWSKEVDSRVASARPCRACRSLHSPSKQRTRDALRTGGAVR